MNFLTEIYYKRLAENDSNIRFWENYIQSLKSLDFKLFSDNLKVPALVPIGNKILFRGELIHTNEVTVALGADYFVKCSLKQAEELRQHRIKDAQTKLDLFLKEKEYLENQLSFHNNNDGQEIIEMHTEEEDKLWRQKHRENVKKYKQSKSKEEVHEQNITDEELWEKLEELELREELENELTEIGDKDNSSNKESFIIKESDLVSQNKKFQALEDTNKTINAKYETFKEEKNIKEEKQSKHELLQNVLHKQNELEIKLEELKNKDRSKSKTEEDLLKKLDEMEELDELEDEMDRLEDILESEDIEKEEDTSTSESTKIRRQVSFADEDDSETLELSFTHSLVEPCKDPYDPAKGIQKPSDIYEAFSYMFASKEKSILKKSKYSESIDHKTEKIREEIEPGDLTPQREIIVVKDVIEKLNQDGNEMEETKRPVSIFKKRRQQNMKN